MITGIVIFKDDRSKEYTVLNIDTLEKGIFTEYSLAIKIESGELKLLNYDRLYGDFLKYKQGSENRIKYASDLIFILYRIRIKDINKGFDLCIVAGNTIKRLQLSNEQVIELSKKYRLANAKVVRSQLNGRYIVSALEGNFEEIEVGDRNKAKPIKEYEDRLMGMEYTGLLDKFYTEFSDERIKPDAIKERMKKSKYKKTIQRALVLGLVAMQLAAFTGCGDTNSSSESIAVSTSSSQMINSDATIANSNEMNFHSKIFTTKFNTEIKAGDQLIGEIVGETFKILDKLELKDTSGTVLMRAEQKFTLLKKSSDWDILNAEGILVYRLKSAVMSFSKVSMYLEDADGNKICNIKTDVFNLVNSATVKDNNDKLIATISGQFLTRTYDVIIEDDSSIDNQTLSTIIACYVKEASVARNNSKSSKSKN